MTEPLAGRHLTICSRINADLECTDFVRRSIEHVLTMRFPRAVFRDLTDDTVSVDVEVTHKFTPGNRIYIALFKAEDGFVIKRKEYTENCLHGKTCMHYDPTHTRYDGDIDGCVRRSVTYSPLPVTTMRLQRAQLALRSLQPAMAY